MWLVLVAVLVAGALVAKRLYDQAMDVRSHLESSISEVAAVQTGMTSGDLAAASAASQRLSDHTEAAVAGTRGRLWSFAEAVPVVGANLSAVRLLAETTDDLARDVVAPASGVNLETLRPVSGAVDLAALAALSPLLDQVGAGVDRALEKIESIDRDALVEQVGSGVDRLADQLVEIQPSIDTMRDVIEILPAALGANGPRDYLLMFQGNSEARSLGGNAASFLVLHAEAGRLELRDQATSSDFTQPLSQPVVPLDPAAVGIYGEKIGEYTPDLTMVPDFPSAVNILKGWWSREGRESVDAVMSLDPVALSYLLQATGPITLTTGDVLTADNAVQLLLNEPYFRYDSLEQNLFFSMAAGSVFTKLTSGEFSPIALMTALSRSVEEGRLLYVSDDARETELIGTSQMSGIIPSDDASESFVGVFVNDNTGSKKSYYLDMDVAVCRSGEGVEGEVALSSSLTAEVASSLPLSITGPYYPANLISTYVVVYGPAGSQLTNIELDGQPAKIETQGDHLGRPAVKVDVVNDLVSSHTLTFGFSGGTLDSDRLSVRHSPMTRATDVTVDAICG